MKATLHENPLTEDELRWVWTRYQRCGFAPGTFAKRFARNAFESLTDPKGRNMAVSLAFQYRRQVIHWSKAKTSKLTFEQFVRVVRSLYRLSAAKPRPCTETPLTLVLRSLLSESTPEPQLSLVFA